MCIPVRHPQFNVFHDPTAGEIIASFSSQSSLWIKWYSLCLYRSSAGINCVTKFDIINCAENYFLQRKVTRINVSMEAHCPNLSILSREHGTDESTTCMAGAQLVFFGPVYTRPDSHRHDINLSYFTGIPDLRSFSVSWFWWIDLTFIVLGAKIALIWINLMSWLCGFGLV